METGQRFYERRPTLRRVASAIAIGAQADDWNHLTRRGNRSLDDAGRTGRSGTEGQQRTRRDYPLVESAPCNHYCLPLHVLEFHAACFVHHLDYEYDR